jgi:hypothetical protein
MADDLQDTLLLQESHSPDDTVYICLLYAVLYHKQAGTGANIGDQ